MPFRRLGATALLVLVWCARPTASAAQPAPAPANAGSALTTDAKTEARTRFQRGLALYGEGAYEAALAEFRRSRELYPTRAGSQNAALALRKLNRFDEALELLEQVQREYPSLPAADREGLDRELAEVRLLVGSLGVVCSEPGATVIIDGRERGVTPITAPVRVAAGSHVVRVYKEGFLPFEAHVDVAGKQAASVDARLGALTRGGRLSVSEDRGTAVDVIVDGARVGKTPWEGTLPVGSHTVTLRGEGDVGSPPASVDVRLNQLSKLALVAEPLPCSLRVEPTPLSASVAVDGVDVGHGVWQGPLRCGGHALEIAEPGFLPAARTVSLSKGQPRVVGETLERDPNSPLWRAENPPRITLDARGALLLSPSLGGDVATSCTGACSRTMAVGALAMLRFGYQLGSGLGFAADAGYMALGQKLQNRAATVQPVGLPAHSGVADDAVRLSGVLLGASASFERGEHVVWMGRLGAGALLGTWSDTRSGTFSTGNSPASVTYTTPELTETGGVRYLYVNPEARVGYRFGKHFILDLAVSAVILVGLSDASWQDTSEVSAGQCPSPDTNKCAGRGGYGHGTVLGKTIVAITPLAGARYEF